MKGLQYALVLALLVLQGCASMGISPQPLAQLNEKYSDETSKFLAIDDLVFHYQDEGTGPTVVLLHGVASSLHTWDGWTNRFKEQYRVIRIDLPGHGLTGKDPSVERYELAYMIDKLEKFLNKLSIDDIYLAGNSLGGYIAWNYALHRPDRVKKLILLDSAGYPQDMPFIMDLAAMPVIGDMSKYMMPKFLVNMNVNAAYGDDSKASDKVKQRYFDLVMRKGNREALVDVFRTMKEQSTNPLLGKRVREIRVPTLLMWGSEDEWVPMDILAQFERDIPGSQTIVYEGVGHMPMEELPVQTARDAHAFFSSGTANMPMAVH